MSFTQCLDLPPKFLQLKGLIHVASKQLASALPGQVVYSVDEVKTICKGVAGENANRLLLAMEELGILNLVSSDYCRNCALPVDSCICSTPMLETDKHYEVVGNLMELINQMKTMANGKPYFISFCVAEAMKEARALYDALAGNGIPGFLSDRDLVTGSQWRDEIMKNLKLAKVFFCLETPSYHERPRCATERDFAVASGIRVIRVGLCSRNELSGEPAFMQDIQHDIFKDRSGRFLLTDSLLGIQLPRPLNLDTRKGGAYSLVNGISWDIIGRWASLLHISTQIPEGSDVKKTSAFLDIVFGSPTLADSFCRIIDLKCKF